MIVERLLALVLVLLLGERPEHAALDLDAVRRRLDDHQGVVRERLLERRVELLASARP